MNPYQSRLTEAERPKDGGEMTRLASLIRAFAGLMIVVVAVLIIGFATDWLIRVLSVQELTR